MFANFGAAESLICMQLAQQLRSNGVACEVYPSANKLQKQMKYANDRLAQWVVLLGEEELSNKSLVLKNMINGEQTVISFEKFVETFLNY
jgi:histidyl-tRNA synthetase